jgi:cell division protein FtsW
MRENNQKLDFILLSAVAAVVVLGILILSSASAFLSQAKYHDSYYLLKHQLLFGVLPGLLLGLLAFKIPVDWLRKFAPYLMALTVIALGMVFIPFFGMQAGGAQRWIHVGFTSIQPSEILKFVFVIYLASWLSTHSVRRPIRKKIIDGGSAVGPLLPFLVVLGSIGVLVIMQPDLSTFGIITAMAVSMYFAAGTPIKHLFIIAVAGCLILLALVYFEPYRLNRFASWVSPQADPMGSGFQANQALIIASSGGLFGQGFGSTASKYALLPELIGDSVFAPFAAETGFVGCILLIGLYAVFVWRCLRIAGKSMTSFERLAAVGVAVWFAVQSVLNIASTLRLVPLSGVPLPLISYGGTATMMELAAVGFMLNLSRRLKSGF